MIKIPGLVPGFLWCARHGA